MNNKDYVLLKRSLENSKAIKKAREDEIRKNGKWYFCIKPYDHKSNKLVLRLEDDESDDYTIYILKEYPTCYQSIGWSRERLDFINDKSITDLFTYIIDGDPEDEDCLDLFVIPICKAMEIYEKAKSEGNCR